MLAFHSKYKIFCDVETSGLSPIKGDVIVSSLIITSLDLKILDRKTFYIKPLSEIGWDLGAEKIHGISYKKSHES